MPNEKKRKKLKDLSLPLESNIILMTAKLKYMNESWVYNI